MAYRLHPILCTLDVVTAYMQVTWGAVVLVKNVKKKCKDGISLAKPDLSMNCEGLVSRPAPAAKILQLQSDCRTKEECN